MDAEANHVRDDLRLARFLDSTRFPSMGFGSTEIMEKTPGSRSSVTSSLAM